MALNMHVNFTSLPRLSSGLAIRRSLAREPRVQAFDSLKGHMIESLAREVSVNGVKDFM